MMGLPLKDWPIYSGLHTRWSTRRHVAGHARVVQEAIRMMQRLAQAVIEARQQPRPG